MPAYSTDWIKRLNQLRQVDPDAVREIERRGDQIFEEYDWDETARRDTLTSRARAMEQEFQEYERTAGATAVDEEDPLVGLPENKKNYKMPLNRPYDDPQEEAAIQQIMQQQRVGRAEAIRIYRMLAEDPQFPFSTMADTPAKRLGPLSVLGEAGRPKLMAPGPPGYTGFGGSVRGPSKDDSGGGEDEEGYIGPGEKYVEPSGPKVAPGEELVRDTSPQMSGGQEIYGEAATQREPLDTGLGVLGALATAGGAYFTGRDIRASDKRQARGTASANLINALAGNIVAQAPRTTPSAGVGTSMMKGLATASGEILRQREAQRALDQQSMLTKLTLPKKIEGADAKNKLDQYYFERGGEIYRKGIKEDVFSPNPTKFLSANDKRQIFQLGGRQRTALIGKILEGYRKAFEESQDQTSRTGTAAGRVNDDIKDFFEVRGQLFATGRNESGVGGLDYETSLKEYEQSIGIKLTPSQKLIADTGWGEGYNTGENFIAPGRTSTVSVEDDIYEYARSYASHSGESFWAYLKGNPNVKEALTRRGNTVHSGHGKWLRGLREEKEDAQKRGKLPTWAQKDISDMESASAKMDLLESKFLQSELKGAFWGRLPAFQWLTPNAAEYEKLYAGFIVDIASMLNRGRPSDKDAEAVMKMLPNLATEEAIAVNIFASIRSMLEAKKKAIEGRFHLPVWNYVSREDGFDYQSWYDDMTANKIDATTAEELVEDLNRAVVGALDEYHKDARLGDKGARTSFNPRAWKDKQGNPTQDNKDAIQNILMTFEKAGFTLIEDADGQYSIDPNSYDEARLATPPGTASQHDKARAFFGGKND